MEAVSTEQDAGFDPVLRAQMSSIETALVGAVESDNPVLSDAATHIIQAGGKRFRPLLVVVGSQFGKPYELGDQTEEQVRTAAVVVELTHVASLYHDDVMDDAVVRRGTPSANARWGNLLAILVGDYLFVSKYSYGYSRYSMPFGPNLFSGRILGSLPQRGDVAVFKLPRDTSQDYIKRIIGLEQRVSDQQQELYDLRQELAAAYERIAQLESPYSRGDLMRREQPSTALVVWRPRRAPDK